MKLEDTRFNPLLLPGLLSDQQIRHLSQNHEMITPYVDHQISEEDGQKVISYGESSYGYDCRLGTNFKIFTNVDSAIVDVKNFDPKCMVDRVCEDYCIIPPNSFVLGYTMERFRLPRDVLMVCLGKSTYARAGIIVNVTPGEPEWEGYLTLEFSNTTSLPVKLYAKEGCCQMLFLRGSMPCEVSYKDRKGKYQDQAAAPVAPRLKDDLL